MKYCITSRGDIDSETLKNEMVKKLSHSSLVFDEEEPDLVISIGGDGTLLSAFHHYIHRLDKTAFIGVHTGHLGFYADWTPEEIDKLIDSITNIPYQISEHPLLEVVIEYKDSTPNTKYLALNEFTVKSFNNTLVMDVAIKGEHFETFRGDGLCVSTPSGSTAYNKGLGGAIIHPSIAAIQLTEMASINNRVFRTIGSPLILPAAHNLVLTPIGQSNLTISVDQLHLYHENVKSFKCRVAHEHIRFARYRPIPFWKRVKDSFVSD